LEDFPESGRVDIAINQQLARCPQGQICLWTANPGLGYTGRAASKNHPDYLVARRDGRLILNLVDVDDVNFVSPLIIDAALDDIHLNLMAKRVLVHCNRGLSRSPSIALLYLTKFSDVFGEQSYDCALRHFQGLYPLYAPAKGMADYVRLNWHKYSFRNRAAGG
jgi:hypothetical protein